MRRSRMWVSFVLIAVVAGVVSLGLLGRMVYAGGEKAGIELLDAGSGEKRPLRFTFEEGATDRFEMRMKMSMSTKVDGRRMPAQDVPAYIMPLTTRVESVDQSGEAEFVVTYGAVSLEEGAQPAPAMKQAFEEAFKGVGGTEQTFRMTETGEMKNFSIRTGESMTPMMKQMMQQTEKTMSQMTFAFPDEPVGEGARWRERTDYEFSNIRYEGDSTVTATSISDERVSLRFEYTADADRQTFAIPEDMPGAGQEIELLDLEGSGSGTAVLGFRNGLPRSMEFTSDVTQELRVEGVNGEPMTMTQEMTMEMSLSSVSEDENGDGDGE